MIGFGIRALAIAGLLAAPALAQTSAMPVMPFEMRGGPHGKPMFGSVSPEGKAVLRQAMRDQASPEDRAKLRTARDQVAIVLSAETLDTRALKRAMDEERKQVDAQQARRQAGMLAAFQKLSTADRKAFVEDARRGRDRLEEMVRGDSERQRAKRVDMMAPQKAE